MIFRASRISGATPPLKKWKINSLFFRLLKGKVISPRWNGCFTNSYGVFSYQIKPLYTYQEPFKLEKGNIPTWNSTENKKLVGGFNPFEKYVSTWVHLPQSSGWNIKKYVSCHHPENQQPSILFQIFPSQNSKLKPMASNLWSSKVRGCLHLPFSAGGNQLIFGWKRREQLQGCNTSSCFFFWEWKPKSTLCSWAKHSGNESISSLKLMTLDTFKLKK